MASRDFHTALRVVGVLAICGGAAFGLRRCETTPEQADLEHFVTVELPHLQRADREVQERLERLGDLKLKPEDARKLITDDLMPRLVKLSRAATEVRRSTAEVDGLCRAYAQVIDRVSQALRVCLKAIDAPTLVATDALAQIRAEFAAVDRAYRAWDDRLDRALRAHDLAPIKRAR